MTILSIYELTISVVLKTTVIVLIFNCQICVKCLKKLAYSALKSKIWIKPIVGRKLQKLHFQLKFLVWTCYFLNLKN